MDTDVSTKKEEVPVEGMPLGERVKAAESAAPFEGIAVGKYIDARDTLGNWCVAEVVRLEEGKVTVNYDGWSTKYDDTLRLKSSMVAPFRNYSRGYTGQIRIPLRKRTFCLEDLEKETKEIKAVIESNLECLERPTDITQYLRGRLFTTVDFLMANEYKNLEEEIPPVIEYFKLAIRLIVMWLRVFPKYFRQYAEGQMHPRLIIVDRGVAMACCLFEVTEILRWFFCLCHRTLVFHERYDVNAEPGEFTKVFDSNFVEKRVPAPSIPRLMDKIEGGQEMVYGLFVNLFNEFCKEGGLKAVMDVVLHEEMGKKAGTSVFSSNRTSLEIISSVISPFRAINSIAKEGILKDLVSNVKSTFLKRIESLDEKDIKESSKDQLIGSMSLMKGLLTLQYGPDKAARIIEKREMLLSLKYLECSYLEKRIQGLGEIKKMIERVEFNEPSSTSVVSYIGRRPSPWLTAEYLANWIVKNEVLQKVLNQSSHSELIRRSAHLLSFLARQKLLTSEMITNLWKCKKDMHEDFVLAVYDNINEILPSLSPEHVNFIFAQLKETPIEEVDEKMINFMEKFTSQAIAQSVYRDSLGEDDGKEVKLLGVKEPDDPCLYCVPLFWRMIQDESAISVTLTDQAAKAMKETIKHPDLRKYLRVYLGLCIQNLKNHRSVQQSIHMAYFIFLVYSQKGLNVKKVEDLISKISKESDLVDMVLDDITHYLGQVQGRQAKEAKEAKEEEDAGKACFVGKYAHLSNIEWRLKFLEYVVTHGSTELKLGRERLLRLWKIFVTDCKTEHDTSAFLKWLASDQAKKLAGFSFLVHSEYLLLFETICGERERLAEKFTVLYFNAFDKVFKEVNRHTFSLSTFRGRIQVKDFKTLVGLESIWENVAHNKSEDVGNKFRELLVDLHLNLAEEEKEHKLEIWRSFIDMSMGAIIEGKKQKQEHKIANMVKLLLLMIETMEGKQFVDRKNVYSYSRFLVSVTNKKTDATKKLEVPLAVTVGQLRKNIADAFGLPFFGFQMAGRARVFTHEENYDAFKEMWENYISITPYTEEGEVTPRLLLSQNNEYISHLFSLLSEEAAPCIDTVWELIMALSPIKKIQEEIESLKIEGESAEAWSKILDPSSVHKFLYSLQVVEEILNNRMKKSEKERQQWMEQFCTRGGLTHIFYSLLKLPISALNQHLTRKCYSILMHVLVLFQTEYVYYEKEVKGYTETKQEMIARILYILEAFAEHSILPESEKVTRSVRKMKPTEIRKDAAVSATVTQESEEMKLIEEKRKRKQLEESKAIEYGFRLIEGRLASSYNYFEQIAKFPNFQQLLLKGLILSDNPFIQNNFFKAFNEAAAKYRAVPYSPTHPHVLLISLMLPRMIQETIGQESKCQHFYKLLQNLLRDATTKKLEEIGLDYHKTLCDLAELIKRHRSKEGCSSDMDNTLIGLLDIMDVLLRKFPSEKRHIGQDCKLVEEILLKCLFEFPRTNKKYETDSPPKCKSRIARESALSLLCTLARNSPDNLEQILGFLTPIHASGTWRTKRSQDWSISPVTTEKSLTGYVGLKNLGCICYLNSVLQQLFMIPSFRNDILAVDDPKKGADPNDNLLLQTQCLFAALYQSVKQYYNPAQLCKAFKDWDGKSINVYEQMDADEFLSMLLDKLETAMKGTPQAKTVQYHFGGIFANQLICKDCPHSRTRKEPFLAINLQVKNKKTLEQCLDSYVEGEMLQGTNAYHCEACDKKVTTLMRTCIKRLPRFLIFVLKRFDINYDTMEKFKINSYCEFPHRLDMEGYTEEGLARKDKEKEREKARKEGKDVDIEFSPYKPKYPREYYDYKLSGVVIHLGSADAGHYYSLIMDREKEWVPEKGRWYEFNDTLVEKYDLEDMPGDSFGGEEKFAGFHGMMVRTYERSRNAYLLIYERATSYDPPEEEGEELPQPLISEKSRDTLIEENIYKAISAENVKYWYTRFFFHEEYFRFALNLGLSWNPTDCIILSHPSKNLDYHLLGVSEKLAKQHSFQSSAQLMIQKEEGAIGLERVKLYDMMVFKYVATVVMTTAFRAAELMLVAPGLVDMVKAYVNKHHEAAEWMVMQFCNSKLLKEMLLECTQIRVRRLTAGILYCAMLKLYEREREAIGKSEGRTTLVNFLNCVLSQFGTCKSFPHSYEYLLQILARMAFIGPEMRAYMLRTGVLVRLLEMLRQLTDKRWSELAPLKWEENPSPELGLPTESEDRFRSFFEEIWANKQDEQDHISVPINLFLVDAICLLLRAAKLDPSLPASPHGLAPKEGFALDPATKTLVMSHGVVDSLLTECSHSITIKSLSKAFCHLGFENIECKSLLIKRLVTFLDTAEFNEMKPFFYLLQNLATMEDSTQSAALELALTSIQGTLKNAQNIYLVVHIAAEHITSMAGTSRVIREWYTKNNSTLAWLEEWLKKNPYPPTWRTITDLKLCRLKENNFSYAHSSMLQDQAQWKLQSQKMILKLTQIREGKAADDIENNLQVSSVYYDKFLKNQQVRVMDIRKQWEKGVVIEVLDEMVCVRPERLSLKYSAWHEVESEEIALDTAALFPAERSEPSDLSPDQFSDSDEEPYFGTSGL